MGEGTILKRPCHLLQMGRNRSHPRSCRWPCSLPSNCHCLPNATAHPHMELLDPLPLPDAKETGRDVAFMAFLTIPHPGELRLGDAGAC